MIGESYKQSRGEVLLGKKAGGRGADYHVLYIPELHGRVDFVGLEKEMEDEWGWGGRAEIVWDNYGIQRIVELGQEERGGAGAAARAAGRAGRGGEDSAYNVVLKWEQKVFPRKLLEEAGCEDGRVSLGRVWRLQGDLKVLVGMWKRYCAELFEGRLGGNCDTYDYWPAAFDAACIMCKNLEELRERDGKVSKTLSRELLSKFTKFAWSEGGGEEGNSVGDVTVEDVRKTLCL